MGKMRGSGAVVIDIDPFAELFLADPFAHHAALRDAGPVVWLESTEAYGIARFDEVQLALLDHKSFCSGRGVGLSDFEKETPWRPPSLLLEADRPLHDRTRGLVNKVVSLKALKALRPRWTECAANLADTLVARGRFDAVTDFAEVYPMMVFPDTIGVPVEGREHLLTYAAAVFNAFGPRNAIFHRDNERAQEATAWVAGACKRENLTLGGWGMAVYEAADAGECSADEAERLVRSFLSAGIDTTVNGLAHMIYALATHPVEFDRLRAAPTLAKRAFEESLRWDSTVQTFFRTTARDVEIAGVTIPEGEKVLIFMAAANRDPRKWDNPDTYDLSRQTSGHVGFGFGIHQCLGQMVARLEGELMLEDCCQG
jgi:4-methoxybenzoate monooxygenase (O-demethylating)